MTFSSQSLFIAYVRENQQVLRTMYNYFLGQTDSEISFKTFAKFIYNKRA